jgi:ABC-2 type transport system permease protein
MRKLAALWRRELVEHRGAFIWAPVIIFGLLLLTVFSIVGRARFEVPPEVLFLPLRRIYEDGIVVAFVLWWLYAGAALFFYLADAFSADRRNNAMLFWKSMPVTDVGMLLSKITFGMAAAVVLGFVLTAVTGLVLALLTLGITFIIPTFAAPPLNEVVQSYASLMVFAAGYLVLSVLWYAPFLAWVAGLSTVVRRWSIPLAFFVPGALTLMEVSVLRSNYVGTFLSERLQFGFDWPVIAGMFSTLVPLNGNDLLAIILLDLDWIQLGAGVVLAVVFVYLASLWRKRGITS